jgi:hypothetical protein
MYHLLSGGYENPPSGPLKNFHLDESVSGVWMDEDVAWRTVKNVEPKADVAERFNMDPKDLDSE